MGRTRHPALAAVAERTRPVALAGDHVLPVVPLLQPLLPAGLRRGTTMSVTGSTSLALAVLAGPSSAGSWCGTIGLPSLGLMAAAEAGVALDRLALVADPGDQWATVVGALLDALDVVLVRAPRRVRVADARRLAARARERGTVLVALDGWDGADIRLHAEAVEWRGLGEGAGHLREQQLHVVASGRRAAGRERRVTVELSA